MVLQFSDWYVKQWQIPQARTSRLKFQWICLLFRRYGTKYSSVQGLKVSIRFRFLLWDCIFTKKKKKTPQFGISYTTTKYCRGKFFWWISFGFLIPSLCISFYALHNTFPKIKFYLLHVQFPLLKTSKRTSFTSSRWAQTDVAFLACNTGD